MIRLTIRILYCHAVTIVLDVLIENPMLFTVEGKEIRVFSLSSG